MKLNKAEKDKIYTAYMAEKSNELAHPSRDFYRNMGKIINEFERSIKDYDDSKSLSETYRNRKAKETVAKTRLFIRDIFSRRMKKILQLAFLNSMKNTRNRELENLTTEEKIIYHHVYTIMESTKKNILDRIIAGQEPESLNIPAMPEHIKHNNTSDTDMPIPENDKAIEETSRTEGYSHPEPSDSGENRTIPESNNDIIQKKDEHIVPAEGSASNSETKEDIMEKEDKKMGAENTYVQVRFIKDMEEFMGLDGNAYPNFMKGDLALLPKKNAELFIRSGDANMIKEVRV